MFLSNTNYFCEDKLNRKDFNNFTSPSKDLAFMWIGEYVDGSYITEINYKDLKERPFGLISRESLIKFGILGAGYHFFYSVWDGVFHLNNEHIEFLYRIKQPSGDKIYKLTGQNVNYKDVICYKDVTCDIDLKGRQGEVPNNIYQYNFGYKQNLYIDGVKFVLKVICHIPVFGYAYMTIRLVCDQDLKGDLMIKNKDVVNLIEAPLEKNKAGQVQWYIN